MTNEERKLIIRFCLERRRLYEISIHKSGMLDSRSIRLGGEWSSLYSLIEKLGLVEEYAVEYRKLEVN